MEKKKDLVELGFKMKLIQKDLMSKVVCNALGDMHHIELNHTQWKQDNNIDQK